MPVSFNPDDPKLTAYVLGELSTAEAAEVEQLLHESPEARAAVEGIRRITDVLAERLPTESTPCDGNTSACSAFASSSTFMAM